MPASGNANISELGYEPVFTVYDYHDGPRSGVANFHGIPHSYECVFNEKSDDYSDVFVLIPIGQKDLESAIENWEIFLRWRKAFDSGQVTLEEHPAMTHDKNRYLQTKLAIDEAIVSRRKETISARGEFEVLQEVNRPRDALSPWMVRWSEPIGGGPKGTTEGDKML